MKIMSQFSLTFFHALLFVFMVADPKFVVAVISDHDRAILLDLWDSWNNEGLNWCLPDPWSQWPNVLDLCSYDQWENDYMTIGCNDGVSVSSM